MRIQWVVAGLLLDRAELGGQGWGWGGGGEGEGGVLQVQAPQGGSF